MTALRKAFLRMTALFLRLELAEVVEDLGVGPVLRGDELAAQDSFAVDDVGFGNFEGAVEVGDALRGIAQSKKIDVVVEQEGAIGGGVFILADGENGDLGHTVLQDQQAGQFFDAGHAPGGPEVEDNSVAAQAGERDGLAAVGEGELGRG